MQSFFKHPKLDEFYKIFEKEVKSPFFEGKFDLFYYCFLIGISANKRDGFEDGNARDALELAKRFPNDFLQSKLQILNILLTGYTLETKKKVEVDTFADSILKELVDHDDTNQLTDQGYKRMNAFAYAGFEILYYDNNYQNPMTSAVTMLKIKEILDKNFSKAPWV